MTRSSAKIETPIPHSRTVLADEDVDAAVEVLRSGQVNESETARELERVAGGILTREYAHVTGGGTAALYAVLASMGIGAGDEVLVPTYVCDDVLSAVLQAGATPIPIDLDPADLNPDPSDAASKAGPATKCAVLCHALGMPARIEEFEKLGIDVVEDCAHGLGSDVGGAAAGSRGRCTVLSFHGLKMVTAGEGGMVLTGDEQVAAAYARTLDPDFAAGAFRLHSRMSNVLAAIAIRQLGRLERTVRSRRALATRYLEELSDLGLARPVAVEADDGRRSSCYRFALVAETGFDQLEGAFLDRGVIVRRPVKQLSHRSLGLESGSCPKAEATFDRIISLPLYPSLSDAEQSHVIAVAKELLG